MAKYNITLQLRSELGESDKRTRRLQKQAGRIRTQIRHLLRQLEAWERFVPDSAQQSAGYDEATTVAGDLPWEPTGSASTDSHTRLWFQHHFAIAELARFKEQLQLLPLQAKNVIRLLEHQQKVIACLQAEVDDVQLSNTSFGPDAAAGALVVKPKP